MPAHIYPVDAVGGAPSNTGRILRQTAVAPFLALGAIARPLGALSGVRPGTPSSIGSVTSTTWTVNPFGGALDGESLAIAGPYTYSFDDPQTGSVSPTTGTARADRLDVQINDAAESDGTPSTTPAFARIVYTQGTSTTPPAAPPRSHPLFIINVPASGAPTLTWNASFTAAAGGIAQFLTLAGSGPTALQAWTTAAPGQRATVISDPTALNNADYVWNGTQWAKADRSGLTLITPTSVAGTGVTVGANGVITFAAAPAVSLNGIFSAGFDNYRIVFDMPSSSVSAGGGLHLRAGGADDTGGDYSYQQSWSSGSSVNANNAGGGTQWGAFPVAGVEASAVWDLFDPALAKPTRIHGRSTMWSNPTTGVDSSMSGRHSQSVSYDGITYTPSTGTVTGTMRVYGYNNGA